MNYAVVYKSKTGFVKKYAEWIAEELGADVFEVSKAEVGVIKGYDAIIYGGSLHAVGIIGVEFIKNNFDKLKGKRLAVFASGASPYSEAVLNKVRDANFTKEQQSYLGFFYLRGGFDYDKLPVTDKLLMTLLKLKIRFKKARGKKLTGDEAGMFSAYSKPVDFTNKKNIDGILEYVRN